jgi:hypothetical protein
MSSPVRVFAVVVATALAAVVLRTPAVPAEAAPTPQHPSADADFTGIGSAPWNSPFFRGESWLAKPEPHQSCWLTDPECAWYYEDYRLNCLPVDSPGPAYQLLWVRPDTESAGSTYLARHRAAVLAQLRAAASVYAASNHRGLHPTNLAEKGRDRTPRFTTTEQNGTCDVAIEDVAVPAAVLARAPLQNRSARDTTKQGLLPYLEANGYDDPQRRYFAIVDDSMLGPLKFATTWFAAQGNAGVAAALNLQSPTSLWGPYGKGVPADVDTSPGPSNFCNRGGELGYLFLPPGTGPNLVSPRGDRLAQTLAHELGHTLCQDAGAPHFEASTMHFSDREDIMGDLGVLHNQCGPIFDQARWMSRFDCKADDYWGQTSLDTKAAWTATRWDSSDNEFLWGAPKNPDRTAWYSLRDVNMDCRNLGGCVD